MIGQSIVATEALGLLKTRCLAKVHAQRFELFNLVFGATDFSFVPSPSIPSSSQFSIEMRRMMSMTLFSVSHRPRHAVLLKGGLRSGKNGRVNIHKRSHDGHRARRPSVGQYYSGPDGKWAYFGQST